MSVQVSSFMPRQQHDAASSSSIGVDMVSTTVAMATTVAAAVALAAVVVAVGVSLTSTPISCCWGEVGYCPHWKN